MESQIKKKNGTQINPLCKFLFLLPILIFFSQLRASAKRRASSVVYGRNLSMRGPTQPDPVTLLRSLYLWNGLTDSRTLIFDRHQYPPVLATARDTCRVEECRTHPTLGNSKTVGPIAFKIGVCLETS